MTAEPEQPRIRLVLADDHTLFREGLAQLILTDPVFEIVGEAADGTTVLHMVPALRPDIVVLDVEMPGPGARATVTELRRRCPEVTIVVLTMHQNPRIVQDLLDRGAAAYLMKSIARDQLVAGLRAVHHSPRNVLLSVSRDSLHRGGPGTDTAKALSARELQVMRLTAEAYSNAQIAKRLGISEATVKRHLTNIYAKLGAVSRVDSIRKATAAGIISQVTDIGGGGDPV